jgi:biopolymer transport protein ExbB
LFNQLKNYNSMKKIVKLLVVLLMTISVSTVFAQEGTNDSTAATNDTTAVAQDTTAVDSTQAAADTVSTAKKEESAKEETNVPEQSGLHYQIKKKFIEGGAGFMGVILLSLIFGLALAIERILYLNLATINTKKFIEQFENALFNEGIDAALEVARNTRGPVASLFYQGLMRYKDGNDLDMIEKSIVAYGSVQMGLMERGLTWIALFIALAPMLGFMGTVIGMIEAFDAIQKAGDISATLVAGGIKVALITTVSGLIVAIILQIFYNYIVSKVDALVTSMEDSSISFMDILVKYNNKK